MSEGVCMAEKKKKARKPAPKKAGAGKAPKERDEGRHNEPISPADAKKKWKGVTEEITLQADRLAKSRKSVQRGIKASRESFENFPRSAL